ncbi:MAG: exonuclease SbcCD subunit D [Lachnospira sp.]|nr:exonuclease SbcCD subunit D [Lachnospira sp.]
MKFAHLSDLHLGLRLNGLSLAQDQAFILDEIIGILEEEQTDAVLIAGDVYDSSQPSAETVSLYSEFLEKLSSSGRPVLIIPGNHDSAARLSFASGVLARQNIFIAPAFDGKLFRVTLDDKYGPVVFTLLPYLTPFQLRPYVKERPKDWTEAVSAALSLAPPDPSVRNVCLTHQFITYRDTYDGVHLPVERGGLNNVDVSAYRGFDYVAAGHVHRPERIGPGETVRYCGSPLVYAAGNIGNEPAVPIVTLGAPGQKPEITYRKLMPLHQVRAVQSDFSSLMAQGEKTGGSSDYLYVLLQDENPVSDGMNRLRQYYPNIVTLSYPRLIDAHTSDSTDGRLEGKTPEELTVEFFTRSAPDGALRKDRREYLSKLFRDVAGEEDDG